MPRKQTTVKGLFRLTLPGPKGPFGLLGAPTNGATEAERVVRNSLAIAVQQIPSHRDGLVLVDPGLAPEHEMIAAARRWFDGPEGNGYRNIVGALFIAPRYTGVNVLRGLVPVWRKGRAPRAIDRSKFVDRLFQGLNFHVLTSMVWRDQRGTLGI